MKFERVRQQNFYVAHHNNGIILKSYNTIVGLIYDNILYRVRYSTTTGKQITKYANQFEILNTHYVSAERLNEIINKAIGLNIDTRYNCA